MRNEHSQWLIGCGKSQALHLSLSPSSIPTFANTLIPSAIEGHHPLQNAISNNRRFSDRPPRRNSLRKMGFLIKGHKVPAEEIEEIFALGKEFFSLPEEQKEPWPIKKRNIGYVASFKDKMRDYKMSMWFDDLQD